MPPSSSPEPIPHNVVSHAEDTLNRLTVVQTADAGDPQPRPGNNRFQILSLDGGGIKGLFSAALLAAIEEDLGTTVTDHFDLITGTSTGGIIALGLGIGMRPREIVEFYVSKGPAIFRNRLGWRFLLHWARRKYPSTTLVDALVSCFKDKRLADSRKRLVIPAYSLGEDDVYLFRTPHAPRLRRDYKVPLWKVAQATSAAPSYFPSCRCIDSLRLVDGGVWANNPTLVGIVEAAGTLGVPLGAIHVFSIGTSDPVNNRRSRLNEGGKLSWARDGAAIDLIMRGQSIAVHNQATFLLGKDRVERINPPVTSGEFTLDGTHKAEDLVGKASHHSRVFMPTFENKFFGHRAAPYSPLYS
jgi:predicted acylesterase/phospholipase RssA